MVWPLTIAPCVECRVTSGWLRYTCPECKKTGLCADCCDYPAVLHFNATKVACFCKTCFKSKSTLDFTTSVDVLGPEKMPGAPCVLFVHGGGGCRAMFRAHAAQLANAHDVRCVLMDLPGHGALMDVPLTTESAINEVIKVTKDHCNLGSTTYVGGSFGGYLGYSVMRRTDADDYYSSYVIACASQNIGIGSGWKAKMGLVLLGSVPRKQMLSLLCSIGLKNKNLLKDIIIRDSIMPGMFFGQGANQIAVLRQSDALAAARCRKHVVYLYGTKDHHDIQDELVRLGAGNAVAVAMQDSDHFFTHDKRYFDTVVEQILKAAQSRQLCPHNATKTVAIVPL